MSTTSSRQYNFVDDRNSSIPITASRVDAELDNIITKLNQKVIIAAGAPGAPVNLLIWADTTNKQVKQYRNSEWVVMGVVHVGTTAPTTMQSGDVWIDTSGAENVIKYRNQDNDAWITVIDSNSTSATNNHLAPTGSMTMWLTDTAPTGWLLCYGQAVSRTTYAALFNIISTTFGVGDGSTTFNLPDMRGRFPLGQDDMGGSSANRVTATDADTIGGADGDETKNLQHNHGGATGDPSATVLVDDNSGGNNAQVGTQTHTHSISNGGSTTQDIMPPFLTVNYIIKT